MSGVQTSYSQGPATALKGELADNGPHNIEAGHANGTPRVGLLVALSGPTSGALENAEVAPLAAITVSATAILASTAAAATPLSIDSSSTPALQTTLLNPARRITAVLNSHANWDATKMRIEGEDAMGNYITDTLTVPDAGAATITSNLFFSRVTKVELDAQAGTAATFTMGYTADEGVYHPGTVGVLVRNQAVEPLDSNEAVADDQRVDVLKGGRVYVSVEAAVTVKGAPAYLRTATSGGNIPGQWRSTPAAGFTRQPWAFFETLSDSNSIAVLKKAV